LIGSVDNQSLCPANKGKFDTGEICDIPRDQLEVKGKEKLKDFEITEFQVIMRGRMKKK